MTAIVKPENNTLLAAAERMEEQDQELSALRAETAKLRAQNENLREKVLRVQLEASVAIGEAKFEAAQVGAAHRRCAEMEKAMAKLDDAQNQTAQIVQGLVDLPAQVDGCVKRDQEYENMRSNVSLLMGDYKA